MRKHELDKRYNRNETGVELKNNRWHSRSRKRKAIESAAASVEIETNTTMTTDSNISK